MTKKMSFCRWNSRLRGRCRTLSYQRCHGFYHIIYLVTFTFSQFFFLFPLQACTLTWFQFSILSQNIVPWLSNFDSSFALLTTYVFGDQILKVVDETNWVSNNFFFGLIQVWGHTVWCGLVWTPKSVIFGEAFSTSLLLHIYHWRRLDTFDTYDSPERMYTNTSRVKNLTRNEGFKHLDFFHCVCLLLIWQYRNVYSIRHHSSFFSSVGRIFPSLQRHVLALWRQVRQIEPTHNGE